MKCRICETKRSKKKICEKCMQKIVLRPENVCSMCGRELPSGFTVCPDCKDNKLYYDRFFNLGCYRGLLGEMIKKIKFKQNIGLCRILGNALGERIGVNNSSDISFIIPVPCSIARFHERGFNQAYEIAKGTGKFLNIKVKNDIVKKKEVEPLEHKRRDERQNIMKNAFLMQKNRELNKDNIMIIDDVYTTGATANFLAKVLKQNGAGHITVAVLAR